MASQCECDNGDPFTETQEGRNVLGFYVGDDQYRQANYTPPFSPQTVTGYYSYEHLDTEDVEDATQIGYYHRFQLDAIVYPSNSVTASIEVIELHFQIFSKEPFQVNQKYFLNGMLPNGLLPKKKNRVMIMYRGDLVDPLLVGSGYTWDMGVPANDGYIEFTKFKKIENPENSVKYGVASGHFELSVDVNLKDGTVEKVLLKGGVFDAMFN
jgi:hypothetical protein